jgi:hypothetical protein
MNEEKVIKNLPDPARPTDTLTSRVVNLERRNQLYSNTLKVKERAEVTITKTGTGWESVTAQIPHGLGYYPIFFVYYINGGGVRVLLGPNYILSGVNDSATAYADTNKIYITVYTNVPKDYIFTYYIMLDTL